MICPAGNGNFTLDNIYTDAIIVHNGTRGRTVDGAGGLVGNINNDATVTISNCVFAGSVSKTDRIGGLVGAVAEKKVSLTISDCAMLGTVSGSSNVGGFIGYSSSTSGDVKVQNCAQLGTVESTGTKHIIATDDTSKSGTLKISDCYYLTTEEFITGATSVLLKDLATTMTADNAADSTKFANWSAVDGTTLMLPTSVVTATFNDTEHGTPVTLAAQKVTQPKLTLVADTNWFDSTATDKSYTITTPAELLGFGSLMKNKTTNFADWTISLGADINLNPGWDASSGEPAENSWQTGTFHGVFDGGGYSISGIYATRSSVPSARVGFIMAMEGATVQNLAILNSYFESDVSGNVGSVIGRVTYRNNKYSSADTKSVISNVYSDAIVVAKGVAAGGLVGQVGETYTLTVENCVFAGTVTSNAKYVGGIVGYGINGSAIKISNCLNMGTVSGLDEVGGIIGRNSYAVNYLDGTSASESPNDTANDGYTTLTNCVNIGTVVCTETNGYSGDLIGQQKAASTDATSLTITNSYWTNGANVSRAYGTGAGSVAPADTTTIYLVSLPEFKAKTISGWSAATTGGIKVPTYIATNFADEVGSKLAAMDIFPSVGTLDETHASYTGANGSKIYYYTGVTEANYTSYIAELKTKGFTANETTYSGDGNKYTFLTNTETKLNVYVSFIDDTVGGTSQNRMRVFVGSSEDVNYNLNTEADAVGSYEAALWQLDTDENVNAGGMSYVIRLTNGKFIIIDGGYDSKKEADNLYSILYRNNVLGGKPVVAAWFLTHGHNDHYGALKALADEHGDKVVVESFYYNLPSYHVDGTDYYPGNVGVDGTADKPLTTAKDVWPGAVHYTEIHSGMKMAIGDALVEVLATHEDVYHSYYHKASTYSSTTLKANDFTGGADDGAGGDDTSTVLRFTVAGKTILLFADAEQNMAEVLASTYTDSYMKSDYVQLSGHGYDITYNLSEDIVVNMCKRALNSGSVLLVPADIIYYNDSVLTAGVASDTKTWVGNLDHDHGQAASYSAAGGVYVAYKNEMFLLANATSTYNVKQTATQLESLAAQKVALINATVLPTGYEDMILAQTTSDNDEIRFVGVLNVNLNNTTIEEVGYKISIKIDGGQTMSTDLRTTTLYTSVIAGGETVTASALGGNYVYALELYGLKDFAAGRTIEFVVTGIMIIDGNTYEYGTKTISVAVPAV